MGIVALPLAFLMGKFYCSCSLVYNSGWYNAEYFVKGAILSLFYTSVWRAQTPSSELDIELTWITCGKGEK